MLMKVFSVYPVYIEKGLLAQFPLVSRGLFPNKKREIISFFQYFISGTKRNPYLADFGLDRVAEQFPQDRAQTFAVAEILRQQAKRLIVTVHLPPFGGSAPRPPPGAVTAPGPPQLLKKRVGVWGAVLRPPGAEGGVNGYKKSGSFLY